MRKILLSQIEPGMILGKKVFSPTGHILLVDGTELSSTYLMRMQALGISAVFVKEHYTEELFVQEIISEATRIDSIVRLRGIFEEVKKTKVINTTIVKSIVNNITDEVVQNKNLLFEISDIRPHDSYLYGHCVNVCVMAVRVGLLMNYNEFQLRDLGIGALLHDIGAVFTDKVITEKSGKLSPEEFEKMKLHSTLGFDLLRKHNDINLLSAHVAFQHHERIDGTGYPRAIKTGEISEYARIVAIADMFDALTSERRYRKSFPFHIAMALIKKEAGTKIDSNLVHQFFKSIAVFPTGTLVELNTGEIALIVSNSVQNAFRPVLRILTDRDKRFLEVMDLYEIDLMLEKGLNIIKLFEDNDEIALNIRKKFN